MDKFIIRGGKKLTGKIEASGSKNTALKAMVAACLTDGEVIIDNIPLISDSFIMADIIKHIGGSIVISGHRATIRVKNITNTTISLEKAALIRTSCMFLAPLLTRTGEAIIPNPGGCRLGARPIDRTVEGLRCLGAEVIYSSEDGFFYAKLGQQTEKDVRFRFEKNTHTGTETLILASVLRPGTTVLENAAAEPEVDDLISLLRLMGAEIKRTKEREITIHGVEKLHGASYQVPADRNEIVTLAIAAVMTEGDITVTGTRDAGIAEFLEKYRKSGGGYEETNDGVRFFYNGALSPVDIETRPYPGFMTDWQSSWAVMMIKASGVSLIHETVFENRFSYVLELRKMGANIVLFNPHIPTTPNEFYNFNSEDDDSRFFHGAKITGPVRLHNGVVTISDLRAGATLVLAALAASGRSVIFGVEKLDRGYEKFELRLQKLGADIQRVREE